MKVLENIIPEQGGLANEKNGKGLLHVVWSRAKQAEQSILLLQEPDTVKTSRNQSARNAAGNGRPKVDRRIHGDNRRRTNHGPGPPVWRTVGGKAITDPGKLEPIGNRCLRERAACRGTACGRAHAERLADSRHDIDQGIGATWG